MVCNLIFKDNVILKMDGFWSHRWVICVLMLSLAYGVHKNMITVEDDFHKLLSCIEEGVFTRREFLEIYECMLTTLEK